MGDWGRVKRRAKSRVAHRVLHQCEQWGPDPAGPPEELYIDCMAELSTRGTVAGALVLWLRLPWVTLPQCYCSHAARLHMLSAEQLPEGKRETEARCYQVLTSAQSWWLQPRQGSKVGCEDMKWGTRSCRAGGSQEVRPFPSPLFSCWEVLHSHIFHAGCPPSPEKAIRSSLRAPCPRGSQHGSTQCVSGLCEATH